MADALHHPRQGHRHRGRGDAERGVDRRGGQIHEELANAGALYDATGLKPTSNGWRIKFRGAGGRFRESVEFTDDLGLFASFFVWAIFGALLLAPQLTGEVSGISILYAVVSLTLVRMLPVAIAMIGTKLRPATIMFMGWFGPRGLASVVFTLIAFETLEQGDIASERLIEVATWTVFISVIAHGLTAGPLATWYGRRIAEEPAEQSEDGAHADTAMPRALSVRQSRGV